MTTSSRKSYNYLALRGAGVDDMEFVEQFKLDPAVAYTPQINDVMLDMTMNDNISAGMDAKKAGTKRAESARDIKELLAKNGMLK